MNRLFTNIIIISVVLFLFSPLNCIGAENFIPDEIARDLATLEAAVIKGSEGRYLLNMGTNNHIKKGNLWTLYSTGEQIIDPVTGKKLGALPVPLAVCNVIHVEKYFSEITINCFSKPCTIQSGFTAHRFRDIKATFQDVNGSSFHLYELIRARLPELDWQEYQRIENTPRTMPSPEEIVIVADKKNITIWNGGEILTTYEEFSSVLSESQASIIKPELPGTEKKVRQTIQKNIPGLSGGTPGLNTFLEIKGISAVADIDHPLTSMGIMTPVDSETPYFIWLYNKTVDARAVDGTEKYQYDYKGFGEVINMSIGHNGLVVLNIYVQGEGMRSRVLRFSRNGFTVLSKDIDHFMKFSGISENNGKLSLIGQNFDADSFFGLDAFHLDIDIATGEINRHNTITVPPGFRMPGAFFADLNGNGIQESAFYNAGGKLVIYEDDKQKWESPAPFGSSSSILVDDMTNATNAPSELRLWPQPVLFKSDNLIFAVIPANNSGFWRIASVNSPNVGLGILCPHNNTYTFRLLNTRFQGPILSISLYGNNLYVAVVEGSSFTGKGNTHILAIPMQELKESLK